MSKALTPGEDLLFLAKTTAYEKPGLLSMRSRRMFVQVGQGGMGTSQQDQCVWLLGCEELKRCTADKAAEMAWASI